MYFTKIKKDCNWFITTITKIIHRKIINQHYIKYFNSNRSYIKLTRL
jgi:hypothetical protein